ncbi:MAG: ABC transporter substrate-binding protein [Nitrospirae bacterium]|nr:ABC transporter substrate-binding protein [Nitrospirota bacterium]
MASIKKVLAPSLGRIKIIVAETFGLGPAMALSAMIFILLVVIGATFLFIYSAPPDTIIITSGDDDTRFLKNAEKYQKILARNKVKLTILKSEGSLENLKRLADPSFRVDVGFVQTGVAKKQNIDKLLSLGSISYEPLYIFYRSTKPLERLSQFNGKRVAIGEDGTGTHVLALELLAKNGINPGDKTELLEMDDEDAEKSLLEGKIDAVFMMSDSASSQTIRELLRTPGIRLFDFSQADAYSRRIGYLNKIVLPMGSIDFGKNIPEHDVNLISPTVELIARADLHPALSDLLLEAATEVHSRQGLTHKRGEFPAMLEHEYRISPDAARFYKSGKSFLYKYLPFWMASLINRILVIFVPMLLILIPGLKSIPVLYRWRMRLRLLRWYRALLILEEDLAAPVPIETHNELLERLNRIEETVNKLKVPASFADQFFTLRSYMGMVRERLMRKTGLQN